RLAIQLTFDNASLHCCTGRIHYIVQPHNGCLL
ncbi:MAG: hypothetical protein ACI936_003284, partial [Paraglaciecola sp.]